MLRYSEEHQWVRRCSDNCYEIGVSAYGAEELGELNFVELPKPESKLYAGMALCVVESVKAASDLISPLSGSVIEVNAMLENNPALINESPEQKGWICRCKDVAAEEFEALMSPEEYQRYIGQSPV